MSHKILKGLYYSPSHEWIKVEGDIGTVGISDFAQAELGDIVYVDLPDVGKKIKQNQSFGAVESVKAASDLNLPVSGEVIEVNEALNDEPELLNQDPYANFIIKIKITNKEELKALLDSHGYEEVAK